MKESDKQFFKKMHNSKSPLETSEILREKDKEFSDRRDMLYKVIETLVSEQRQINPNFGLTYATLDKLVKGNSSLFFGLTSASSVMRYWNHEMNFLKEKLGLQVKRKKRVEY